MKNNTGLLVVLAILCLLSPDKQLFTVSSILLMFLFRGGWRDNEPKVIFLGVIFYWLTVCTLMLYGVFFNIPMVELTLTPDTFIYTTYLSLFATFCYSSGIFIALKKVTVTKVDVVLKELEKYDAKKLLLFYSLYSIFSSTVGRLLFHVQGLSQLGTGIIWLKWAFLTLLIVHTILFPSNQKYVYIILIVEVVLSFTGFWSSFKDYLFIAAAAFLTFSFAIDARKIFVISLMAIGAFLLMVVWTVVKGEYRQYLTGGIRSQVVVESGTVQNLTKIYDLVNANFNAQNFHENFLQGVKSLANRINYTEYFAMSIAHVPAILPFENGELLKAAFEHVFEPRLFFPNKKTIDDSEITSKYTGRLFAGEEYGASFSLGLVAERYIDYGPVFMFIPIFLLGFFIGVVYKYILTHSLNHVWGLSFVAPLFFFIPSLGIATTKFLGWSITYFLVWFFFNKYLVKRVDAFLRKSNVRFD